MRNRSLESFTNKSYETLMSILDYYNENVNGSCDELDFIEEYMNLSKYRVTDGSGTRYKPVCSERKLSNPCTCSVGPEDTSLASGECYILRSRTYTRSDTSHELDEEGISSDACVTKQRDISSAEENRIISLALINPREHDDESYRSTFGNFQTQREISSSTVDLSGLENHADPDLFNEALVLEPEVQVRDPESSLTSKSSRESEEDNASDGRTSCSSSSESVSFEKASLSMTKVNQIYLDSNISMNRSNPRDTRPKRLATSFEEQGNTGTVKVMLLDDYKLAYESTSTLSVDSMEDEAIQILVEAEKRALRRELVSQEGRSRRFIIDKDEQYLEIQNATKLNDLKSRNLLGKIHKKGKNGRYQHNWFSLRENFFTCYDGKKYRIFGENLPSERDGDIRDPTNDSFFFKKKYTLDLLNTKIYLVNQPMWLSCVGYCLSFDIDNNLIDITDDMKIVGIRAIRSHFIVCLKKDLVKKEVRMNTLDFAMRNNDGIYFYRFKDIDSFLSWTIAFAFRQGKISLDVG